MEHYRYALPGRVASVIAKRRHQPYEYCSLSQPTSIRVVVLHPPSNDCLIHCSVEEVDLASKSDFEALSYTWAIDRDFGGPRTGDKRTIICNGKAFDAQKNLYNALIQLRRLGRGLPLWIDAICIDQGNNAEKSVQVNMMGDIYRTAKTVIVWLGRSTLVAQLSLKQAAGFFTGEWFQKQAETSRKADVVEPGIWLVALLVKDALLPMSALSWILRRGWFSRVWTVQESVLARDIVYFLGSRQLPLDDLARFSAVVKDATESLESGLALTAKQMLEGPRFLLNARENVERTGRCTLEEAIVANRYRKATDSRDKVFAVLGFCTSQISADYRRSVQEVYCECAAALLHSETGLFLLSLVGQVRHERQRDGFLERKEWEEYVPSTGLVAGLPSWVPDLSSETQPAPLRILMETPFTACLGLGPYFAVDSHVSTLQLKAAVLGNITEVGDSFNFGPSPPVYFFQPLWEYLRLPGSLGAVYAPTGEPTISAFWKTLTAGSISIPSGDVGDAPVDFRHFLEWFVLMVEDGGDLTPAEMRAHILGLDDKHLWMQEPSSAPLNERKSRDHVARNRDLRRKDVRKISAVRAFIATLDEPVYGLRQAIQKRHDELAPLKREPEGGPDPPFKGLFERAYVDRRLFTADNTYLGLAPWTAQVGDVVMLVAGAYVPFVFRASGNAAGGWELIGEAYCHGVMSGEGLGKDLEFKTMNVV